MNYKKNVFLTTSVYNLAKFLTAANTCTKGMQFVLPSRFLAFCLSNDYLKIQYLYLRPLKTEPLNGLR